MTSPRLKLFNVSRILSIGENDIRIALHPNAYLNQVRNVRSGLVARTKIFQALESQPVDAAKIAIKTSLSYGAVMHHLRLLENEGTIHREGVRPYYWSPTGLGQKRLVT